MKKRYLIPVLIVGGFMVNKAFKESSIVPLSLDNTKNTPNALENKVPILLTPDELWEQQTKIQDDPSSTLAEIPLPLEEENFIAALPDGLVLLEGEAVDSDNLSVKTTGENALSLTDNNINLPSLTESEWIDPLSEELLALESAEPEKLTAQYSAEIPSEFPPLETEALDASPELSEKEGGSEIDDFQSDDLNDSRRVAQNIDTTLPVIEENYIDAIPTDLIEIEQVALNSPSSLKSKNQTPPAINNAMSVNFLSADD